MRPTLDRLSLVLLLSLAAQPAVAQERALAPLEVRPSPAFQAAVEAGTRTETGEPGPQYWQQRADYAIDVTVDGREEWSCTAPGTLRDLPAGKRIWQTNLAPVLDPDGALVGVISQTDLLLAGRPSIEAALRNRPSGLRVGELMTSPALTAWRNALNFATRTPHGDSGSTSIGAPLRSAS